MLTFDGVHKGFPTPQGFREVLRDVSLHIPAGARVAVLGVNGAGKSTLLALAAGTLRPDRGEIRRRGRISWPLGLAGGFHPAMTGRQNLRFLARILGLDGRTMVAGAEGLAALGPALDRPFGSYSAGMRARLALAASLVAEFDVYLVDEIIAVGDAHFRARLAPELRARLGRAGLLMVSHAEPVLRQWCSSALVLDGGRVHCLADLEAGLAAYRRLARPGTGGPLAPAPTRRQEGSAPRRKEETA